MIYTYPYTSKVAGQDPGSASDAGPEPKPVPAVPAPGPTGPAAATSQPPAGPGPASVQQGPTGPAATDRPATNTVPAAGATDSARQAAGQTGAEQPIFDPVTLNEIAGYATLPILLALISAFLTDKPAIPLALALAGLGAAYYSPWVKENINVMRLAEALFGGNTSNVDTEDGAKNNAPPNTTPATNDSGTSAQGG